MSAFPTFAHDNTSYMVSVYIEPTPNISGGNTPKAVNCSYSVYVRLRQFRASMILSFKNALWMGIGPLVFPGGHPPLANRILSVIFWGARNQMLRVATWRVVAGVEDKEWVRIFPCRYQVGKTARATFLHPHSHLSIAPCGHTPHPRPALIGSANIYSQPKTAYILRGELGKWFTWFRHLIPPTDLLSSGRGAQTPCLHPLIVSQEESAGAQ